ncbi:hypothetical protein EUTSA_v10014334mg [Eutrema salsugineum]|uniref:Uncharacterized protein n=1 Tax=Eutrema salsugineum TaxID=72664 RepID=V4KU01_EUTSA|nr:uncharacterized protein LOC18019505 [Eutrema salsugineum]ESQ41440.1 hypothetical protein EUTSA_v10014334mg [Eutrema salsugineum]
MCIYTHRQSKSKSKCMNRDKKAEFLLQITMQEFSPTVSFSPSFSFYASGDVGIVEAAVRVVRDSQSYSSVKVDGDEEAEFEFETLPLREESFFHFPTTTKTFEHSPEEEEDDDVAANRVTSKNLLYGGWNIDPSLSSPSQSNSSSESDDSENPTSSKYHCFWSPIRSPARGDSSKNKSSSAPRRCRFKDLLRRSHSDGAVTTSSESKRCRFKDLLRRSHSGGDGSSISSSGNGSLAVKGKNKTASYKPTNIGEVDKRRKTYLPYRQNLIGVFAGISRFRH